VISQKLEYYRLNPPAATNVMLQRMSGNPDPVPFKVLAAVVQPPQGYVRGGRGSYNAFTPRNHLVDAVPPESETARTFHNLVQNIVAGKATAQQWQQARQWLTLWRDNDAQLQPLLVQSQLTQQLIPVSHTLKQVAVIGLQALDDLENSRTVAEKDCQHSIELLKSVEQPQAVLLDMIAPSVELLVQATRTE